MVKGALPEIRDAAAHGAGLVRGYEVAIKTALSRHNVAVGAGDLRRALFQKGYEELVVNGVHAAAISGLPHLHRDPFDRLPIAQAISERVILLTADKAVLQYPGPIRSAA